MRPDIVASLLSLLHMAAGHGAVTGYRIGGVNYPGYEGFSPQGGPDTIQRQWSNYDPVFKVADSKMRCNGGTSAKLSANVAAGSNITALWKQWTHEQGPVMVWMYPCEGDFASCAGDKKMWFKIDQKGLISGGLKGTNWGTGIVASKKEWTSTIPANIKPGNYLIRHELLALHQANNPQFYPECAQLVVSGSGTDLPPADFLFSIPGYAQQSDPGVTVNIDMDTSGKYTCPAGLVWSGWSLA